MSTLFIDFQNSQAQLFFQQYIPEPGQTYVEFTASDLEQIAQNLTNQGFTASEVDKLYANIQGVMTLSALADASLIGDPSDVIASASFDESGILNRAYFPAIWQYKPDSAEVLLKVGKNSYIVELQRGNFVVGDLSGEASFTQASEGNPRGVLKLKTQDGSATFKIPFMINNDIQVNESELEARCATGESIGKFLKSGSSYIKLRDLEPGTKLDVLEVRPTPDNKYSTFMLRTNKGMLSPNSAIKQVINNMLSLKQGDWQAVSDWARTQDLLIGDHYELSSGNVSVTTAFRFNSAKAQQQPKALASGNALTVETKAIAVADPF